MYNFRLFYHISWTRIMFQKTAINKILIFTQLIVPNQKGPSTRKPTYPTVPNVDVYNRMYINRINADSGRHRKITREFITGTLDVKHIKLICPLIRRYMRTVLCNYICQQKHKPYENSK